MPRFYTDFFNNTYEERDRIGREFESEDAAFAEAGRAAAGVLGDDLGSLRSPISIRLELRRDDGTHAGQVEVDARVRRQD